MEEESLKYESDIAKAGEIIQELQKELQSINLNMIDAQSQH